MKKIFTLLAIAVATTMSVDAQRLIDRSGQREQVMETPAFAALPQLKLKPAQQPKTGSDSVWTSLGMATYTDDFVTAFYTKPNYSYPVEIQECDTLPGFYRLVDPYGAAYPGNTSASMYDSEIEYMYIHAENPSQVYIEHYFLSGMVHSASYGEMRMSSIAGYRIAGGTSVAASEWGRLDTNLGTITFPSQKLLVSMPNYHSGSWAVANKNGAFCVQLPGYPNYAFSHTLGDLIENNDGTATQRIYVQPESDSDFIGFRFGTFSAQQLSTQADSCVYSLFDASSPATTTDAYCDALLADSGANYVLIVSVTANGVPAKARVVTISYSPDQYWTSLGSYTLRDALISETFAGISPMRWTVEVQRYNAADSIFRVKDPYLNYPVQFNEEQRFQGRYVIATVTSDNHVTYTDQKLGINISGYGELSSRSYQDRDGILDTVHHELTFPTNGLVITIPSIGSYYANAQNTFLLAKIDSAYNLQVADTAVALLERHTDSIRWSSDYPAAPSVTSSNPSVVSIVDEHTFYAANPGTADITLSYPASAHLLAETATIHVTVEADTNIVVASVQNSQLQTRREYDGTDICQVLSAGTLNPADPRFPQVSVIASAAFADAQAGTGKDITVRYSLQGPDAGHYLLTDTVATFHNGIIDPKQLSLGSSEPDSILVGELGTNVNNQIPVYALYNNSLTQQLYRGSLINHGAGELTALEFFYQTSTTNPVPLSRDVQVYLMNLPAADSVMPSGEGADWIDFAGSTLVGTGTLATAASGPVRFTFDQPFAYTGENLLVIFRDTTGNWDTRTFLSFTPGYSSSVVKYSDDIVPTATNLSSMMSTSLNALATANFYFAPSTASVTASDKAYDGTTDADVRLDGILSGIAVGDDLQVTPTGSFADPNVGIKDVMVSYLLSGSSIANYLAPADDTIAATITPRALEIQGTQVAPYKIWDGNTACPVVSIGTVSGLIGSDNVNLSASANFDTPAKGHGKPVTVAYALGAADTNYAAPQGITLSSSIVTDSILVTIATSDAAKGTTLPTPGSYLYHIGDTIAITPTPVNGQMFLCWQVSENGTVADTDYSATLNTVCDYTMCNNSYTYTAVFDTFHTTYRLTFACTGTGEGTFRRYTNLDKNLCGTDLVVDSAEAVDFRIKPATGSKLHSFYVNGTDRTADLGLPLFGSYIWRDTITADMTFAAEFDSIVALTVTGTNVVLDKVFNNSTTAAVTSAGTLQGLRAGDDVTLAATASYSQSIPGTDIPITISYSISGPDASWYTLADETAVTAGSITPKRLSISGSTIPNKTYDGTTDVPQLFRQIGTLEGVEPGTSVSCQFGEVRFADRNAGENKPAYAFYILSGTHAVCYSAPAMDTLYADILPKRITMDATQVDTAKVYDGTTYCHVVYPGVITGGKLAGDTLSTSVAANYATRNAGSHIQIVVSYSFVGPQGGNYYCDDNLSNFGTISPRPLVASGAEIQLAKEYDGTTDAIVLSSAVMDTLVAIDDVTSVTTADYDTPDLGHNKTITVHYALSGFDAANYICPADTIYSTEGKIILPTILDTLGENGDPLTVSADGYCQDDNGLINYRIQQGEPDQYQLIFGTDARVQGFANTGWLALPADEQILFDVPADCQEGEYTVDVIFKNEANVETAPVTVTFIVNLNKDYMVQLYDDVISIDNRTERFSSYQWYKNGEPIQGATEPYYQEKGGLIGDYYVRVNIGLADEARTCEKYFESAKGTQAVYVYPNPVMTSTKVKLQGFAEGEHVMKVFNSYGVEMMTISFTGAEHTLDMSRLPQGTYMVSVDGLTAKAMKL